MRKKSAPSVTAKKPFTQDGVEIEQLQIKIKELQTRVSVTSDLEKQVASLKSQLQAASETNSKMQEFLDTLRQENKILVAQLLQANTQRSKLQKSLKATSNYVAQLEDRVYSANKTSLDLLKNVRDLEFECATLKNYIIDLKARVAVYVPIKDDQTDLKLAEFINNYPDRNKLKIIFMREGEGVYTFGSKKVHIKIEKGKIMIRVGGGFLSIDEFLD